MNEEVVDNSNFEKIDFSPFIGLVEARKSQLDLALREEKFLAAFCAGLFVFLSPPSWESSIDVNFGEMTQFVLPFLVASVLAFVKYMRSRKLLGDLATLKVFIEREKISELQTLKGNISINNQGELYSYIDDLILTKKSVFLEYGFVLSLMIGTFLNALRFIPTLGNS